MFLLNRASRVIDMLSVVNMVIEIRDQTLGAMSAAKRDSR
jgi:hypothetical protein